MTSTNASTTTSDPKARGMMRGSTARHSASGKPSGGESGHAGNTWNGTKIALFAGTLLLALVWLIPLLWALDTALKPEGETTKIPLSWIPAGGFTLAAFKSVLSQGDIWQWFLNSTIVAVAVTAITLAISSMAAYAFSRLQFKGRGFLLALTLAGVMVPTQILIVPLFREMSSLGMTDTYWALILPQVVAPAMVYILKKFFDGLPIELEEAALMDGASRWTIFIKIIMPLSRSVVAAVCIFTFINTWNNFLWPFIATTNPDLATLPVGLATVQGSFGLRYAQIMASALLAGLPLLVVFVLFQRQIVKGVAHTGLAGA